MKSMTGYGRGQAVRHGVQVSVELTAVNRKQSDIRLNLPKELICLEPRLRARATERISRGAVTVALNYDVSSERRQEQATVDIELAAAVVARLRELASRLGLSSEIRLGEILAVPGVIKDASALLPLDDLADAAVAALDTALDALAITQHAEGELLRTDLLARCAQLQKVATELETRQDEALVHYRDRLKERMTLLGVDPAVDADKLAREAAFLAERSDIQEETTRLTCHLGQFQQLLEKPGTEPRGRNLDFLCQELGREINTLGAKTCDTALSCLALAFKTEIERMREQVQNLE